MQPVQLLGARQLRAWAQRLGVRPTKKRGQNFVVDANTVRKIVRRADVGPADVVLEVGPGLGSLTLALLETGARVIAVELDEVLADGLPQIIAEHAPGAPFEVICADALQITELPATPTVLVANLPYNVSVPVLLHLLQQFESLQSALVMVQAEVADRLVAPPGSRTYGVPSAKAAWFGTLSRAGNVSREIFWPVPNVDSGLVAWRRTPPPPTRATREATFAVVEAAFAQRRKALRAALKSVFGSAAAAQEALAAVGIDPLTRGEALSITQFAAIAEQLPATFPQP